MARIVKPRKQRTAPSTPLTVHDRRVHQVPCREGLLRRHTPCAPRASEPVRALGEERGLTEPVEVTRPVLERYQRYLFHYRKKNGEPLSFASQHSRLSPLRMWFRWMTRQNHLLHNPASEIELPRLGQAVARVLTASEAETILQLPDVGDPVGLRDRAMLEVLYSTGMRRHGACRSQTLRR